GGSAGASLTLAAEPPTLESETVATLQAAVDAARKGRPVPGISAAIHLADGTRWEGVAGVGERGTSSWPVEPGTPFVIASITKTFVAAATLKLAEEGVLSLDDAMGRWLPEHPRGAIVTLRQLLDHTSGEANYFGHRDYESLVFGRPTHHWTSAEILALVGEPRFAPGTDWQYSNTNYVLLGLVLEAATGASVSSLIRDRFLDPLGLRDTWFQGEEQVPVTPAQAYLRRDGRWIGLDDGTLFRPHTSAATVAWAAGAMVSSARDLATWARALYGGRVLSDESLAEMTEFNDEDYGLGAKTYLMGGRTAWGHGGSLRGAEATMRYLPSLDAAVVVLWNRGGVESADLARELAAITFRALYPDTTAPVIDAATFELREGATLEGRLIPARLDWATTETESGVEHYDVLMSVDGGEWSALPTQGPEVPLGQVPQTLDMDLQAGRSYAFSVMATDAEGNVGAWLATPVIRARILQEKNKAISWDQGWRFVARTTASGGRLATTRQTGVAARLRGEWLALAWVSTRSPGSGVAEVSLDGDTVEVVDLAASTIEAQRLVFSQAWALAEPREVTIRTVASPDRSRVVLDALVVLSLDAP
ncbi:MAG: beta-lactamase family protein, partial [Chloroflexota bacterium]|nr:beta-lactamase family protein [Chloroflexota bacterium]